MFKHSTSAPPQIISPTISTPLEMDIFDIQTMHTLRQILKIDFKSSE